MMAFVWMDRERRYFVATGSSMADGVPYTRKRWRQVDKDENASPESVVLVVPQPKACEVYYSVCNKIDTHNRDRQDTLGIEEKLVTNDWSLRVNLTILSMIFVDTWRLYSQLSFVGQNSAESQKEFYGRLAAELIDNTYDIVGGGRRSINSGTIVGDDTDRQSPPKCGIDAHLTPTKLKRKDRDGNCTPYGRQGRCRVCKEKTTYHCSMCREDPDITDLGWICHTKKGKTCFPTHLAECHP
jgi:hypothetical protein